MFHEALGQGPNVKNISAEKLREQCQKQKIQIKPPQKNILFTG